MKVDRSLPALLFVLTFLSAACAAAAPFTVTGPPPAVGLKLAASGLAAPTSITNAHDSRLFVTLQDGRIVILKNGAVLAQPFLDVRSIVSSGGERGLLSVAFHPRYAQNGLLFVDYTNVDGDTVIARYRVSADPDRADPASAVILLTIGQPYPNHNGGQLQFGPDGFLYIGMGDGGSAGDPACRAQRTDSLLGKILRIDVDSNPVPPFYAIPADNPFAHGPYPPETWAYRLRNPWRLSFDAAGTLYMGDVGQDTREEVDLQPALHGGQNYGWKVMEGTLCFSTAACPAGTPPCGWPLFTPPILEYGHGQGDCAIVGGYVANGALRHIAGEYVFGDLCTGHLWTARRNGGAWTVRLLADRAPSLTTFGLDVSGNLYLATGDGNLYRFTATHPADQVGVFDRASSLFRLRGAASNGGDLTVRYGPRDDPWLPVAGDWSGDGRATLGLYDPARGLFRLKDSLAGGAADRVVAVPSPSPAALPIAGDWSGSGKDGVGLYDPATATFYLKSSLDGAGFDRTLQFGNPGAGWIPVAGDWLGQGHDDVGLYDPAGAFLFLHGARRGGGR